MTRFTFVIYFTLTTLFWGGSFLGIRYAIEGFAPNVAAFLRVFTGFVFLLIVFLFQKRKKLKHKLWLQAMGIGVFSMGIPWVLLFWGEKHVAPALAAVINSAVPLFVTIFSPIVTPEDKLSPNKWIGVSIGFIGVWVIFHPQVTMGQWTNYIQGMLAIVFMAVSYAIGILWTRRISTQMANDINLFYQLIGGGLFLLTMSFVGEGTFVLPGFTINSIYAILYLGILSTALALLMFYQIIKKVGSIQASAVTYLIPLVAIILDLIFLDKSLQLNQALGACLILGALLLINRPVKR